MKRLSGFTLLELIVVLSIVGLLMSLVGPALFTTLDKVRVQSEVRKLEGVIFKLSNQAFLYGREIDVVLEGQHCQFFFQGEEKKQSLLQFEHIHFPRQTFSVNSHGFLSVSEVNYSVDDVLWAMDLNKVLSK
ncbi:hypothetical protein GCM10009092_17790 [Bowmanella denitrificans]|uniref:General secretion pathway protein H n=1 Tax=Bowmanella denitrificans TaxID=366582 RepID=A0ABN0X337_9ALTE